MEKAYKAGKVRAIGLSNFTAEQVQEILDKCEVKPAGLIACGTSRRCPFKSCLPQTKKTPIWVSFLFLWARQDLNPRPSGYEPPALTS